MMTGSKRFNSRFTEVGSFAQDVPDSDIKNEPMFFNCDLAFAYVNGGPITRAFIDALPQEWKMSPLVFDSRVHMLMPGWFPCIPGFHHDDVPRTDTSNGQPDYDNPEYLSQHIIGLVNADIAPTEFAVGECTMPEVAEGDIVYRRWHTEVERLIAEGEMASMSAKDRTLIYFDWQAFHQGVRAIKGGWRWFGRVSKDTARVTQTTNEIRRQVQVYLEFPMEGW